MADNVNVTPGSGTVIATRDIGSGIEAQRVIPQTYSTPGVSGGTATDVGTSNPLPTSAVIKDGVTTNLATVAVFHDADNQNPAGLGFGLLTGGVAQLINVSGNLDRQRETGIDNIPGVGIASGTQQLASPFSTTVATSIPTGTQVVTPATMTGFSRGAPWSIQQGSVLTIANSNGSNSENVVVTTVTGTTFTANFVSTKTGPGIVVSGYTYNQARDATTADGATGQGFAAGATFLLNPTLNNGNGGWEGERSAAGEMDGGSGAGAALAAEYEMNSGGPVNTSGKASGLQYDRGRNVQGKGIGTATISSGATNGSTSIVVTSGAAVNLLQPGSPLYLLTGTALTEVVYVSQTYVPGTTTINLQNPVVTGGETTVAFDIYAPAGPGLNGFLPSGIEIAEEAIWDPSSNKFYIEVAATQDGYSGTNLIIENPGLFNGTTFDRGRSASAANQAAWIGAGGGKGAELVAPVGNWSITNVPATTVKATATKAAGGAGVRHVCTAFSAILSVGATAATPAAPLTVSVIDGASGGTTYLWQGIINVPGAVGSQTTLHLSNLALVGSAATAMTVEFSGTSPTNTYQSVSLSGYDIS